MQWHLSVQSICCILLGLHGVSDPIDRKRRAKLIDFEKRFYKYDCIIICFFKCFLGLKNWIPVNIAIRMVDSQSLANFQRQAMKIMEFLKNDDDAFIFESNSNLGYGTLLTGIYF